MFVENKFEKFEILLKLIAETFNFLKNNKKQGEIL